MSMGKGLYDNYKNKKAMKLLGYTSVVYNPKTGDYGEGGTRILTGGATGEEREAMTQLAPSAPYIASGTAEQPSVALQWDNSLGTGHANLFNLDQKYAEAKQKVSITMV